ncbi:MAG: RluA family pseudouridine synthase [Epulopiscium sp.]|nr:RluA family pseudouridine synthase [Candidatus Epulonipiscium sp.]
METYTFNIDSQYENIRLDAFLAQQLPKYSRSFFQKLIAEEKILVNNQKTKNNYKLRLNDSIYVIVCCTQPPSITGENIPLNVLYEDQDLIVLNKPQNMVVHPAPGHTSGTLVNALLYHYGNNLSTLNGDLRPGIVHRIDKDTSGILIVAKNNTAHQKLAQQLKEHTMTRAYHAVVLNNIKEDEGTIDAFMARHPIHRKKRTVVSNGGKKAVTHYKVLERFGKYTYIQALLETGRTHQIRVHMASIGHPILGDTMYSSRSSPLHLKGQVLHAQKLGFIHPTTNQYMEFEAPLPFYFQEVLSWLRKISK